MLLEKSLIACLIPKCLYILIIINGLQSKFYGDLMLFETLFKRDSFECLLPVIFSSGTYKIEN